MTGNSDDGKNGEKGQGIVGETGNGSKTERRAAGGSIHKIKGKKLKVKIIKGMAGDGGMEIG